MRQENTGKKKIALPEKNKERDFTINATRLNGRILHFTLIELLIVISIIAILICILLPALNKAKELGKRVDCKGRLKQIGLAMMQYSNDYNEHVVSYSSYVNIGFVELLGLYLNLGTTPDEVKAKRCAYNTVFTCPSHQWRVGNKSVRGNWGICYGLNYHFKSDAITTAWNDNGLMVRWSMINYPSSLIYILEADLFIITTSSSSKIYTTLLSDDGLAIEKTWHNGYPNQLYTDGHVGKSKWGTLPGHTSEEGAKMWCLSGVVGTR